MTSNLAASLYLISGVLFILALRGLSSPETSRQGNLFGILGMILAVIVTFLSVDILFDSFIFISTTRIYFNSNKTSENDLIHINTNSKNYFFNCLKLSAENFCLSQKNKNIKVVRLSNLYGDHFGKQKYLLPTLIRNSLKKNVIDININKNSKKNYLNVEDAIDVIFKIIHKGKYRLYNVASKKLYTLNFIAKNIQKVTGCKIIYRNQKYKYNEPKININRIKKEFNFKEKNNFGEKLINILKK